MPYPATINAAQADIDRWFRQTLGPFVPTSSGNNRYVIAAQNTSTAGLRLLRSWKSTDKGFTWAEMDAANHPPIVNARAERNYCPFQDGDTLYVAHTNPLGELAFVTFGLLTDTWGAVVGGGPPTELANGFSDDGGGRRVIMCKRTTDNSFWFLYMGPNDLVGGFNKDRVYLVQYNGAWQATTKVFGVAGEARDYVPAGLCQDSAGRLYMIATSNNSTEFLGDYLIYARVLTAGGTLQPIQQLTNQVQPFKEPHVGVCVFDGASVLVPYARDVGGGSIPAQDNWHPAVMRASAADSPVWTSEDVNTTDVPYFGGFQSISVAAFSGTAYAVWIGTGIAPGTHFYYSTYTGGAWSTPTEFLLDTLTPSPIYATVRGFAGSIGLGIVYGTLTGSPSGGADLFYIEVAIASPVGASGAPEGGLANCNLKPLDRVPLFPTLRGPMLITPQLDYNYEDFAGEFNPMAVEALRPIEESGCYDFVLRRAPATGLLSLAAAESRRYVLHLSPGSWILGFRDKAAAATNYLIQITDSNLDHKFYAAPVHHKYLRNSRLQPSYLPVPHPVIAPGIFVLEFFNPDPANPVNVGLVLQIAELRKDRG